MKFNMTLRGDIAPAGGQKRLHVPLLLGMIQPFVLKAALQAGIGFGKRPPLLVPFGAIWGFSLQRH